jgi:hypothetical protein
MAERNRFLAVTIMGGTAGGARKAARAGKMSFPPRRPSVPPAGAAGESQICVSAKFVIETDMAVSRALVYDDAS